MSTPGTNAASKFRHPFSIEQNASQDKEDGSEDSKLRDKNVDRKACNWCTRSPVPVALPNKCNSTSDQIVKWKEMLSILGFRASTIIPVHSSRAATRSRAISSVKWRSVHLPGVETSSSLGCPFFCFFFCLDVDWLLILGRCSHWINAFRHFGVQLTLRFQWLEIQQNKAAVFYHLKHSAQWRWREYSRFFFVFFIVSTCTAQSGRTEQSRRFWF